VVRLGGLYHLCLLSLRKVSTAIIRLHNEINNSTNPIIIIIISEIVIVPPPLLCTTGGPVVRGW
jgi:hypothetical protein